MEKTVLVELSSKQIKLAEGIVLFVLFVSLLAGFGLLSIAVPLGLGFSLVRWSLVAFSQVCDILLKKSRFRDSGKYSYKAGFTEHSFFFTPFSGNIR